MFTGAENTGLAVFSLTAIIRIRTTGCIFAPYIISLFGGRQPTCITQFRLTQKSPSVVSQISERI